MGKKLRESNLWRARVKPHTGVSRNSLPINRHNTVLTSGAPCHKTFADIWLQSPTAAASRFVGFAFFWNVTQLSPSSVSISGDTFCSENPLKMNSCAGTSLHFSDSSCNMFYAHTPTHHGFPGAHPSSRPPLTSITASWVGHRQATVPLNNFRVRTDGVQENQMHCDVSYTLKVPNLDFQPIPQLSKFYSIAT